MVDYPRSGDVLDLFWAAGVFDVRGEIYEHGSDHLEISVIVLDQPELVQRLVSTFGGAVTHDKETIDLFCRCRWSLTSEDAANVLYELVPHMTDASRVRAYPAIKHHRASTFLRVVDA